MARCSAIASGASVLPTPSVSHAISNSGLHLLLCIGEPQSVHDKGGTADYLTEQVEGALGAASSDRIILAYEPIWAIGEHGSEPTREDLAGPFAALTAQYSKRVGKIIYGGSVNASNVEKILDVPGVEGLFVGRSAWTLDGYLEILRLAGHHLERSDRPKFP